MPRKSSKVKTECFISENVDDLDKPHVRPKVCQNLPVEYEHEGKHYCILHYPNLNKVEEFEKEFEKRITAKDYDFNGVYFPTLVSLFSKNFEKHVTFHSATFMRGIQISSTNFSKPVDFIGTIFMKDSSFYKVVFSQYASFHAAIFTEDSDIAFFDTKFEDMVDLSYTTFKGYVTFDGKRGCPLFVGEKTFINLQYARLENPEKISFHKVRLEPSWFVNCDASKLIFTDCGWSYYDGKSISVKTELNHIKAREITNPYPLLIKAGWQIAHNFEENRSFAEASVFRMIANESKNLNTVWWIRPLTLHWWYKISSYYGESWWLALAILVSILFIFAGIYTLHAFQVCPLDKPLVLSIQQNLCEVRTLNFGEAILHSLATATFQNIEYQKPVTLTGEMLRIFEKILVPVQAALLALAIRRKFMR